MNSIMNIDAITMVKNDFDIPNLESLFAATLEPG